MRENIDVHHRQWYEEASDMALKVGTNPSMPRIVGRQTQLSNVVADSPEEYYRRSVTIPFVDHLLQEMNGR